jgi:pyruvate kinase
MSRCCIEAEKMINYWDVYHLIKKYTSKMDTAEAVACAAVGTALELDIDLIIVMTETGKIARYISKYRPRQVILACSISMSVIRQL